MDKKMGENKVFGMTLEDVKGILESLSPPNFPGLAGLDDGNHPEEEDFSAVLSKGAEWLREEGQFSSFFNIKTGG